MINYLILAAGFSFLFTGIWSAILNVIQWSREPRQALKTALAWKVILMTIGATIVVAAR